jgi:hypothetical protein
MIRELEIIFGLHTIPGKLHVARQGLVFFEQLRGVAALAIVLAIAIRPAGNILGTLSAATATAAALTIVDQESCSLSHRALPRNIAGTQKSSLPGSDGPAATTGPHHHGASRPSLAVLALKGVSAAISSGVGGGGASIVEEAAPSLPPMYNATHDIPSDFDAARSFIS